MPAKNWKIIFEKYRGQWVALSDDEQTVIGSGDTAKVALEEAQKKGYEKPILSHLPEELTAHAAHHR